jgi:hypothetical protein
MLQMNYRGIAILCLCVLTPPLAAQAGTRRPSPASAVVASSGSYQLSEEMIGNALRFGQILAGSDFSASDAAALRGDLIATFQKEPAKQIEAHESVAKALREAVGRKPSWLTLASVRYKVWQGYGDDEEAFQGFRSYPFGQMVLKYNPVLVNSAGMIVTKTDVDCQLYADALVAKVAGMAPLTETEKDQFVRDLPSRFASMPREQQEYLRRAELRLVDLHTVYDGTVKTRAAVTADIRKNVHSPADVWREARQVENDAQYGSKYHQLYRGEALAAVAHANRVNAQILGLGTAVRSMVNNMKWRY